MNEQASATLAKVAGEFEEEVMAEIEAGRKETLERVESSRKATAEAIAKILETSVKQAESVKRQIIGAAELEARNAQLKSLEKAVNEVFDAAKKHVSEVEGASQEKALAALIQEGLDVIGLHAKIQCASKDKRATTAAVKRLDGKFKVTIEAEPIETIGGVVLSTPDGTVRFDNTFEARLERMRADLRKDVASVLAGGP
ncbi:MAG: V-type ATP synthase subunit E [Nitrososphaerota archaeon]|nr:V-type ATP synthase subunit E [Nitrososphaerota archaeon]MDG6990591.1 V-type ATP synthase subunit E [Nitrososphaerota archaeon]